MIINNIDFIKTPVYKYLSDMIKAIGNQNIPINLQPIINYTLSSTLLQMTGFMEKKIDAIAECIAQNDFDYKYELFKKPHNISSKIDDINKIYNKLKENNFTNNKQNKSLMNETKYIKKAFVVVKSMFENTKIIESCNSEFYVFVSNKNKIETYNEQILTDLYKYTIDYRHNIAHNIDSVYYDTDSICELATEDVIFKTHFAKYMILIFVDLIFTDYFEKYLHNTVCINYENLK